MAEEDKGAKGKSIKSKASDTKDKNKWTEEKIKEKFKGNPFLKFIAVPKEEKGDIHIAAPKIASAEQLESIMDAMELKEDAFIRRSKIFALQCASSQATEKTVFNVEGTDGDQRFDLNSFALTVKRSCTIRQFCAAWAKYTWDYMIRNNLAPDGWKDRGYPMAHRFAAFDAFHGVISDHSIPHPNMIRMPSEDEIAANEVNKNVAIHRSNQRQNIGYSIATEVTKGKPQNTPRIKFIED